MSDLETQQTERQGVFFVGGVVHAADWIFREHKEVDHGIDAHMESIVNGRVTGRLIALQIKTGPSYLKEKTDEGFVYRGEQRHLDYWLEHSLPVLLLLVDIDSTCIYWVQVTESQVISTGKGWKINVPHKNVLDASALNELKKFAINVKISRPYSQLQLDDLSQANAKRYSALIQLNSDFTKDYILSLASEITKQLALETWMKSPQLRRLFQGRPADVVWLYMCRTVDDSKQGNWLCRTQWISPELNEDSRPMPIASEVPTGEIEIVWSDSRGTMEQYALERELSKGEAVTAITQMIQRVDQHVESNRSKIQSFIDDPNPTNSSIADLHKEAAIARDLYFQGGDIGLPPLELSDLMTALDSVLASYDNIFMLFSKGLDDDASVKRAAILVAGFLDSFDQDRAQFGEEWKRRNLSA